MSERQTTEPDVQWWLAELDQHGNPRLCDGAHSEKLGAEKARYLYKRLGLDRCGQRYAIARVELWPAEAKPQPVEEEAIASLNSIGLRP